PADFGKTRTELESKLRRKPSETEVVSYLLYPKVFLDFAAAEAKYSDLSVLPTTLFFYGMETGAEASIDIEPGKTLIVKYLTLGEAQLDGNRLVYFELNGQPREVLVADRSLAEFAPKAHPKAEPGNAKQVAAPMPGAIVAVAVAIGERVDTGQKLLSLEAMKMETTLYAERGGTIAEVLVRPGTQVQGGDLLIRFE
ncbi:MAG TPA: biotin/lipoyl-containing protein, partial [Gemmata sp.]|nr:biotin/lipoyl-containing protein [Gemmata sp.]